MTRRKVAALLARLLVLAKAVEAPKPKPGKALPERGHDEHAAEALGLHRELRALMQRDGDATQAKRYHRAAAAMGVVGQAYGRAHAARQAGDHEHADELAAWADNAHAHVWTGEHREALQRAQRAQWGRHGRGARAGANLSPEHDVRAQLERAVGEPPKPKGKPSGSAPTPLVHAASPIKRKKT